MEQRKKEGQNLGLRKATTYPSITLCRLSTYPYPLPIVNGTELGLPQSCLSLTLKASLPKLRAQMTASMIKLV